MHLTQLTQKKLTKPNQQIFIKPNWLIIDSRTISSFRLLIAVILSFNKIVT